jgi:hypothetical protein
MNKETEDILNQVFTILHQQERIPYGFLYPKSAMTHEYAIRDHFGLPAPSGNKDYQ